MINISTNKTDVSSPQNHDDHALVAAPLEEKNQTHTVLFTVLYKFTTLPS